jgi:mannose-1-phosphate guanylyltransferase/mannose-6-phosphate isomerase
MKRRKNVNQIVILAGGTGTRLWPLSRTAQPKQLLRLTGNKTLLQQALERAVVLDGLPPLVVAARQYVTLIRRQAPKLKSSQLIIEPTGKGTAVAIAVAAAITQRRHPGAALTVLNSDQVITNQTGFQHTVETMAMAAATGQFAFAGVKPTYPETGYGYIEVSPRRNQRGWFSLRRFHEKPDTETAKKYIRSGRFLWNPGIFCATADQWLTALKQNVPDIASLALGVAPLWGKPKFAAAMNSAYKKLRRNISIDYAIMEKLHGGAVVQADFGWTDVGHWRSVHDILSTEAGQDVVVGKHVGVDNSNNLIYAVSGRLVATVGLRDMVIVDTMDVVLICPRHQAQRVKELVAALETPLLRKYQ